MFITIYFMVASTGKKSEYPSCSHSIKGSLTRLAGMSFSEADVLYPRKSWVDELRPSCSALSRSCFRVPTTSESAPK